MNPLCPNTLKPCSSTGCFFENGYNKVCVISLKEHQIMDHLGYPIIVKQYDVPLPQKEKQEMSTEDRERIGLTVARLKDHSQTVMGVLVKQDIKAGIDLILELYAEYERMVQEIANHEAVNSLLLDSTEEADLANQIFILKEQLKQERNKAIDEIRQGIDLLYEHDCSDGVGHKELIKLLESLKRAAGVIDKPDFK